MKRNTFFNIYNIVTFTFIISFLLFLNGCSKKNDVESTELPELVEFTGQTMGTTYSIKVVPGNETKKFVDDQLGKRLKAGVDALLRTINQQMSTYIPDSEISRFNAYKGTEWFTVSPGMVVVFEESLRVSQISGGAFDITVGPLINLWGFGPPGSQRTIPPESEIKNAKENVGYHYLSVQQKPPALKKENPSIYCSLSAVAKGYGVDKVSQYIEGQGYSHYMVEIGGEVRTGGCKPGNKPWRIAIETPDGTSRFQRILELKDISMATSGDYHNYFEEGGVRYSHTIDPTTGRPITHTLASVTVLHPLCMTADAVATAIDVMGPEKGYALALEQDLPVFLIIRKNNTFIEKMTPRFTEMLNVGKSETGNEK